MTHGSVTENQRILSRYFVQPFVILYGLVWTRSAPQLWKSYIPARELSLVQVGAETGDSRIPDVEMTR